jgi:hypothetical protein
MSKARFAHDTHFDLVTLFQFQRFNHGCGKPDG